MGGRQQRLSEPTSSRVQQSSEPGMGLLIITKLSSSSYGFESAIHRQIMYLDRKGRGWRDFFENWPNFDHIKTCFVYSGGVMQGQRAGSGVLASKVPRAQNRAAKDSTPLYEDFPLCQSRYIIYLCRHFLQNPVDHNTLLGYKL